MIFSEWFYYDESSPTSLRWNRDKFVGKNYNVHRIIKDTPAGSFRSRKSGKPCNVTAMLGGVHYKVHNIVWYLLTGEELQKDFIIDHIDGNPFNNNISNLRKVTQAVNSRNRCKMSNNKSGHTGVSLHRNTYWKVTWYEEGKIQVKYFKITDNPDESLTKAIEFRENIIKHLNDRGYGYSDRHGLSNENR